MENINQSSVRQEGFSEYIKNPHGVDNSDMEAIGSLIEKFPYVQILHAFEAKCHSDGNESNIYIEKAALYAPDRQVLYNLIHNPAYFSSVLPERTELPDESASEIKVEPSAPAVQESLEEAAIGTAEDPPAEIPEEYKEVEVIEDVEIDHSEEDASKTDIRENAALDFTHYENENEFAGNTIVENVQPDTLSEDDKQPGEAEMLVEETDGKGSPEAPGDETEKLIISNIAASDFFRFEEKIDDQLTSHPDKERNERIEESKQKDISSINSAQGVSKYDDDKMPYTFLWWLNKTRKEHSATYQPYVSFKLDTTKDIKKDTAADLNQQIIENIFHLQSPLEDLKDEEKPKTVEFTVKRKGDHIIERFIREEPQIRPPEPQKLDNENKAKRSSEDSYDMVSETLANVYIEQMLFHKAIDTYKKLSLKFPEKSAYFADQIRKLETKN